MASPKKKHIFGTILLLALIGFVLWKFVIKTKKITLANGNTIYMKGGNYFTNIGGTEIKIDQNEYRVLQVAVEGECVNPNTVKTLEVQKCVYYGYDGFLNDCGICTPAKPLNNLKCPYYSHTDNVRLGCTSTQKATLAGKDINNYCVYKCREAA